MPRKDQDLHHLIPRNKTGEKNHRKAAFIEQGLREPRLTLNSLCSQWWFWTPDPPVSGSHALGWQMYNVNSSFWVSFHTDGKWNTRLPWAYFIPFHSQRSLFWFSKKSIITVTVSLFLLLFIFISLRIPLFIPT